MDDGARTRDFRHHKPALYQLSYTHQALPAGSRTILWHRIGAAEPVPGPGRCAVGSHRVRRGAQSATTVSDTRRASSLVGPGGATKTAWR